MTISINYRKNCVANNASPTFIHFRFGSHIKCININKHFRMMYFNTSHYLLPTCHFFPMYFLRGEVTWFGHLMQMHIGRLSLELFLAISSLRWPRGRLRTHQRDYICRNTMESPTVSSNPWSGKHKSWLLCSF